MKRMRIKERTVAMSERTCRTPGCRNRAYSRDICRACYQAAYRIVTGQHGIDWKYLEERGKVSVAREGSPKEWFLAK